MGFLIFEKYFLYVNLKYNKVNYDSKTLRATSDQIIGIDSLWLILTNTKNEIVNTTYITLIINFLGSV